MAQTKCAELVGEHLQGRIQDIKELWFEYRAGGEIYNDRLGTFEEYGLWFGYVDAEPQNYYQWLLSTGGPHDEFRFYTGTNKFEPVAIEYWYMDWFDGAHIDLLGSNWKLMAEIFENYFGGYVWANSAINE